MSDDSEALRALLTKVGEEMLRYAERLGDLDRLATFDLPAERLPEEPVRLAELNRTWDLRARRDGSSSRLASMVPGVRDLTVQQTSFNSLLVQILNGHLDETRSLHSHLRDVVAHLVRLLQALEPMVDARDRAASALAVARTELILEAFDRRAESLARRVDGLMALRDRLETVSEEVHAVRTLLAAQAPPPAVQAAAGKAMDDAVYTAFENRFRGDREDVRERLSRYVEVFRAAAPVADVGCGRGEFLLLLTEAGIEACGVEGNANAVLECRGRGLDVVHGDLVDFLRARSEASLGGIFGAHVAEHLPPPVLAGLLSEAHRVLRPGGLLVLETPNPRSVLGLVEVYHRDPTHERALHPETLRFLTAAAGFLDVRIEMRTEVEASTRLRPVPTDGLPDRTAAVLNENVERLNALLFGHLDYALVASR